MQLQGIGTSWMLQPPRRPDDDAAFNQLIEQMDMDGVRRMMCPKSHGNVEKCKDCEGFRTCKPGQRAMRLKSEAEKEIEEKTAPVFVQKWKSDDEPKETGNPLSIEREEFRRACESGNAWHFLMETRNLSKDAAGEQLSRMIKKFPGLAAEYGGGRRIMQRPKVVRIEPVGSQDVQEEASGSVEEQTEILTEKGPEQAENEPKTEVSEKQLEHLKRLNQNHALKGRERCKQAIASGNPEQFLMDRGASRRAAHENLRRWRIKYSDLFEQPEEPEEVQEPEKEPEPEEDEISLADFLDEFAPSVPEEPEILPATGDDMMNQVLTAKFAELKAEKERLKEQIMEAEERIRCIEEKQDALAKTLSVFGSRAPWE